MTPRQKRVLAILALVNVIVITSLIWAIAGSRFRIADFGGHSTATVPYWPCQWWATQRLAQEGLAGSVTLVPDGSLRFEIIYPEQLKSSLQTPAAEYSRYAQSVWTAFDIALGAGSKCPTFAQVEVTILATDTNIHASVRTLDLVAMSHGELSENEFIERVTYQVMHNP